MKALFVTATAQTEANYYLIWHLLKTKQTNITHIVIISTQYTREEGFVDNLKNVIQSDQFNLNSDITIEEIYLPDGIEEQSVERIKQIILQWINHHQPKQITFNITGGTKLISLALDQLSHNQPHYQCVYQNRQNQLIWYNDAEHIEPLTLPESLETV